MSHPPLKNPLDEIDGKAPLTGLPELEAINSHKKPMVTVDLELAENAMFFVTIDYTNWKGERSERRIRPVDIMWGNNKYHPEEQWLLYAWDLDKQAYRTFAMKDIHSWKTMSTSDTSPSQRS